MKHNWKTIFRTALILSASMLMPVHFAEAFDDTQFVVVAPGDEACKAGEQPCPQLVALCATDNRSTANDAAVYFRYNEVPSAHVVPGRAANAQQDAGILVALKFVDCASYTPAP